MKKIIGIIQPFDIYQTFYVYQNGNKLEVTKTKMNDIINTIFELSQIYNIDKIDLSGSEHFCNGLIKKIKEIEINKYNKNKLDIKCI